MADLDPRDIEDLSRAIKELVRVLGDSGDSFSRMRREVDETSDEISGLGDSAEDSVKSARAERDARDANSQSLRQSREVVNRYGSALRDGERALVSFGRALTNGEASFSKYNNTLSSAGDMMVSFTSNMGLLGKTIGYLGKAITMVAEKALNQADNLLKASDQISKLGAVNQFTVEDIRKMGKGAGLASDELEKMLKPLASMSGGLASLGGTSAEGVKRFSEMIAVTKKTREEFQRLGLNDEERIQAQADFIKMTLMSGRALNGTLKTQEGLQKASLEYTRNLFELSSLTGKDIEESKKLQEIAQAEYDWRLQNLEWTKKIQEAQARDDQDEVERIEKIRKNANLMLQDALKTGDRETVAAFQQRFVTGVITPLSVRFEQQNVKIDSQIQNIKAGGDFVKGSFAQELKQGQMNLLDTFGKVALSLDDDLRKSVGSSGEAMAYAATRINFDEVAEAAKVAADITANTAEEGAVAQDTAQQARNALTETERTAKLALDDLLSTVNPLTQGFTGTTIAVTALGAAAGLAAAAMGMGGLASAASGAAGGTASRAALMAGRVAAFTGVGGLALAGGYAAIKGVEYLANKNLDEKVQKQDKQTTEDANADYNKALTGTGYSYDLDKGGLLDKEGKYMPQAQAPKEIQEILKAVYEERRKKQTAPKMAIGGLLGTNQTAIVGEAGPEFITGPARVTGVNQTQKMIADAMRQVGLGSPFTSSAIRTQTILMERSLNEIGEEKEKELEHLTESNLSLEQMSDNTEKVSNIFKKFEEQLKTLFGVTDEQSLFDQEEERERQRQQNSQNRTGGAPTSAATIKNALNSERGKKALEYFMSQGWTEAQAAGIVGNLMVESGADLQHQAVGDQGQAYGIAQWHPDRQQEFEKAFGKNIRESTFEEQLEFVQHELENKEAKAARMLASVDDPVQAAVLFDEFYERSAGLHTAKRADIAYALATETTDQITTKDQVATTTSTQTAKPVVPDTTAQNVELMAMNARVMTELSDKLSILISKQEENNEILTRVKNNTG